MGQLTQKQGRLRKRGAGREPLSRANRGEQVDECLLAKGGEWIHRGSKSWIWSPVCSRATFGVGQVVGKKRGRLWEKRTTREQPE